MSHLIPYWDLNTVSNITLWLAISTEVYHYEFEIIIYYAIYAFIEIDGKTLKRFDLGQSQT